MPAKIMKIITTTCTATDGYAAMLASCVLKPPVASVANVWQTALNQVKPHSLRANTSATVSPTYINHKIRTVSRILGLTPSGEGPAAGIEPDAQYEAQIASLAPGGRVLIVTDGFIGQRARALKTDESDDSPTSDAQEEREPFGLGGIRECLHRVEAGGDEIAELFAALEKHASTDVLDDDATAVVIRW